MNVLFLSSEVAPFAKTGGLADVAGSLPAALRKEGVTVSPRYSREIQTPEFGMDMEGILKKRSSDLYGILNGVDYTAWNPESSGEFPYDPVHMAGKHQNKAALFGELGLASRFSNRPENTSVYTGTEHVNQAAWEEDDYRFLGFSSSMCRCRCLRGYCEGRDSDCIRDPGIAATLLRGISKEQRKEVP